jgi:peptidoglycan/xylan/chitin deacetylase (PgdA/CDA1 family)
MPACTLHFSRWQTGSAQFFVGIAVSLATLTCAPAASSACADRDDALGTSRVLHVDMSRPRIGHKHFPDTLALKDKEVVLTFDDGPFPPTTGKILDALKAECVRATFFMVGRMAAASPAMAKRIHAEGHTVAYHSFSHPLLTRLHPDKAMAEIERGIAAVDAAAYGAPGKHPQPAFFRFPGFASSPALLERVAAREMVVFGADLWASDWNRMTSDAELRQVMGRLAASDGGILLMHDTKRSTAAMLPALLRRMKAQGYRIVHVVPTGAETP